MTLEIASDAPTPDGDWTWRLSIADVAERGAFSLYPGVDRMIMLLEGSKLVMERGATMDIVPTSGPALAFAGEERVVGVPSGSGVRDVNLMFRRDRWRGSMHVLRGGRFRADAPLALVHAARGAVELSADMEPDLKWLPEGHTLNGSGSVAIETKAQSVTVVCQLWDARIP